MNDSKALRCAYDSRLSHRMLKLKLQYPAELGLDVNQVLILTPESSGELSHWQYRLYAEKFNLAGYQLLYLPEIVSALDGELMAYFLPEEHPVGAVSAELFQSRIASELGIAIDAPSAILCKAETFLLSPEGGCGPLAEFLDHLLEQLSPEQPLLRKPFAKRMTGAVMYDLGERRMSACEPLTDSEDDVYCDEYDIDELIGELKEINEEKLRHIGLSESALRFLMGRIAPKLSRMTVTRRCRIILDDYGSREIKMDDKTKALYFLYLRHPEGLSLKELPDHVNELMDLYQSISGRDDLSAMKKTVDNLVDPYQNNANISISRIKRAFADAFSESLAKRYYVDGKKGGARSVALPRDLVTWETIR